jgi:hypothetical protein
VDSERSLLAPPVGNGVPMESEWNRGPCGRSAALSFLSSVSEVLSIESPPNSGLRVSKKRSGCLPRVLADRNQQADADADHLIVAAPKRVIVCRLDIPAEPALWRRPKHKVQRDFAGH